MKFLSHIWKIKPTDHLSYSMCKDAKFCCKILQKVFNEDPIIIYLDNCLEPTSWDYMHDAPENFIITTYECTIPIGLEVVLINWLQ